MTLTELKYILAVARERHFGRAAEACFVSQPTLSVAIKKLEEELGVAIFERGGTEVGVTVIGERILTQAQKTLDASNHIKEIARQGRDPLDGALRVGVIYTIGPYLLPKLVSTQLALTPQMPLVLQENFTAKLLELLRLGDIDCAILALPLPDVGLEVLPLYKEDFVVAIPSKHRWSDKKILNVNDLKQENMFLLGTGHCFRDQVLEFCPEMSRFSASKEGIQHSFEGSSLETIRHMVAAGLGITLLPKSAVPNPNKDNSMVKYIDLKDPAPCRNVVLVWRRSFTRVKAIEAFVQAIRQCGIGGVDMIT